MRPHPRGWKPPCSCEAPMEPCDMAERRLRVRVGEVQWPTIVERTDELLLGHLSRVVGLLQGAPRRGEPRAVLLSRKCAISFRGCELVGHGPLTRVAVDDDETGDRVRPQRGESGGYEPAPGMPHQNERVQRECDSHVVEEGYVSLDGVSGSVGRWV